MSYDLDEIVVSSEPNFEMEPNTITRVSIAQIERQNATAVSDLARVIPAAHVQTNSRGESLIYVRNAGERQVALFFNGALLNIPWDNRINLDLIPSSAIGGMTVSKGVPSVLYGTNTLGGAINITSRSLEGDGSVTEFGGFYGDHATSNVKLTHLRASRHWNVAVAAGYNHRDGLPLPSDANVPFSQDSEQLRTNTDRELFNIFGQVGHRFDTGTELGLSYLSLDGDYGIAPESHLDPAESGIRYWRYPTWNSNILILNGLVPLGSRAILKGAAWGNWFKQYISSYTSSTYSILDEQQQDQDQTFGTRFSVIQPLGEGELIVAVNALTSEHEEIIVAADSTGRILEAGEEAPEMFSQFVYSVGLEYGVRFQKRYKLSVGGSLDGITTPETGDKPSLDPFVDYGINTGIQYRLSETLRLRGAVGRKVRFPTMRELFGVALNRFLLNPDLTAESSFVTEIGLASTGTQFSGEIIGFYQRTYDTIDQRRVEVDGNTLRQRVNLEGSRVWGIESAFSAKPYTNWTVEGHLTWMNPRGIEDDETIFLTEKPEWLGGISLQYNKGTGLSAFLEAAYTGMAYGLSEDNEFLKLNTSLVLDAKIAYRFLIGSVYGEWFARVDNLFDTTTLPQLGLPGAGRLFSSGLNVSL